MKKYNTSRITVARALGELKNLNYITRQKAKGSFVTEQKHWGKDRTSNAKIVKPIIAVVIPSASSNISIEFEVLQGIVKSCNSLGYSVTIYNNNESEIDNNITSQEFEKTLITELIDLGIVGVLIFPCTQNETPEIYNLMSRKSLPYVILDRTVFGVEAPIVSSENRKGFFNIVEYVISRGHKRIAFVSGNTYESSCRVDRFYGYVKALTDYELDIDNDLIEHNLFPENFNNQHYNNIDDKNRDYTLAITKLINRFLGMENRPTAIVVSNDYIAVRLINIITSLGYRVPDDVSITGFDGLASHTFISPILTTVGQNFLLMGQSAIKLLDEVIKNPTKHRNEIRIPTKLIIGDSVRKL